VKLVYESVGTLLDCGTRSASSRAPGRSPLSITSKREQTGAAVRSVRQDVRES
jgi:hypothetical protein